MAKKSIVDAAADIMTPRLPTPAPPFPCTSEDASHERDGPSASEPWFPCRTGGTELSGVTVARQRGLQARAAEHRVGSSVEMEAIAIAGYCCCETIQSEPTPEPQTGLRVILFDFLIYPPEY